MVDPYSYRERLTQSKLILLSTNDRYWPLDALSCTGAICPSPSTSSMCRIRVTACATSIASSAR